jgi:hypothetical protein
MAGESARAQSLQLHLGVPDRNAIEFFKGAHTIYGHGTFDHPHTHLP